MYSAALLAKATRTVTSVPRTNAPRFLQVLVGVEVRGLLETVGSDSRLADALEREDAHGVAEAAVGEQVEAAVEGRQVVGLHGARRHLVALHRVVADAQRAAREHGLLDGGEQLWRWRLELGSGGADADRRAHGVEQSQGVRIEQATDLVQGRGQVGPQSAGAGRGQQIAAHQQGQHLGEAQLERKTPAELLGDAPHGAVPVDGLVVVDRKASPGQHVDVAPDGPHMASKVARGILDRHAGGAVDQLQQAPLSFQLVAAGHEVRGLFRAGGPAVNVRRHRSVPDGTAAVSRTPRPTPS
jgi:hypothetical protein